MPRSWPFDQNSTVQTRRSWNPNPPHRYKISQSLSFPPPPPSLSLVSLRRAVLLLFVLATATHTLSCFRTTCDLPCPPPRRPPYTHYAHLCGVQQAGQPAVEARAWDDTRARHLRRRRGVPPLAAQGPSVGGAGPGARIDSGRVPSGCGAARDLFRWRRSSQELVTAATTVDPDFITEKYVKLWFHLLHIQTDGDVLVRCGNS